MYPWVPLGRRKGTCGYQHVPADKLFPARPEVRAPFIKQQQDKQGGGDIGASIKYGLANTQWENDISFVKIGMNINELPYEINVSHVHALGTLHGLGR